MARWRSSCFPTAMRNVKTLLREDQPVFVQGQAQKEENAVRIVAEQNDRHGARRGSLDRQRAHHPGYRPRAREQTLSELQGLLIRYPGTCRTFLHLVDGNQHGNHHCRG
jgi:hypothetical protein